MRKPKHMARAIVIGTIAIALFVAIMFVLLFNNWLNGKNENIEIAKEDITEDEKWYKENFYENGWDKRIVGQIVEEEIPIPNGFELESGSKETGLIIKDKETGTELLWIPYDETAQIEGIEEYYKNVEYKSIEAEELDSIEKYGGFYITLDGNSQYETLKQINNEIYQNAIIAANQIYENSASVNSHLISLTELEQVINFANKKGINLMKTSENKEQQENEIKIDKLITNNNAKINKTGEIRDALERIGFVIVDTMVISKPQTDTQDGEVPTWIQDKEETTYIPVKEGKTTYNVPVPGGYLFNKMNKNSENEYLQIINKKTKLTYIWIPVNEEQSAKTLKQAKEKLNQIYKENKTNNDWSEKSADPTDSEEYKELIASIKEYGGFYMAEAELGYNKEGEIYNKARGMKNNSVKEADGGEYYRGSNSKIQTYEKAKEIASKVAEGEETVVSHLTYGSQWDAAMLWIINTNQNNIPQMPEADKKVTSEDDIEKLKKIEGHIIASSNYMPGHKYEGMIEGEESGNLETEKIKKINGLYGIAGNLCDITQETMEEEGKTYHILRGGSYNTLGNEAPMASRSRTENIGYEDIGFRNCLYIKPTGKVTAEDETEPEKEANKYITYSFANESLSGSAQGSIKISSLPKDGTCKLYWGNEQDILPNYSAFVEINVQGGEGSAQIEKAVVIPSGATKIYAYVNGEKVSDAIYSIPQSKQFNYTYSYSFGALSDVHYNGGGNDRFQKILQWYTSQNVDAVMAAGDISAGDSNVDSGDKEYQNVREAMTCVEQNLGNNLRFYSSKGNHDGRISNDTWNKQLFGLEDWQISKSGECYIVESKNKKDLFIMVHTGSSAQEGGKAITNEAIEDLREILQNNYNNYEKIYIFEHVFLSHTSGELYNSSGKAIATSWNISTTQENQIKEILKTFKDKVIMFSGHSHWRYDHQKYNADLNIYNGGGEYPMMVHISSLLAPRVLPGEEKNTEYLRKFDINGGKESAYTSSEAMIVEVYDKAVVLKALNVIPYMNGSSAPECEAYASHIIYF